MKRTLLFVVILLLSWSAIAADLIILRKDTSANWTSNNPVLANGEPGRETDTEKIKWGDGATAWTSLGYWPVLLSADIGTTVQAWDGDLDTWATVTPSANGQSLVSAADYAAMRTLLGLVIGTNVQAWDADLDNWAAKAAPTGDVLGTNDAQSPTNKTLDANSNVLSNMPIGVPVTITAPTDADDLIIFRAARATTLTSVLCIAEGTTQSISLDIQECDSDGASCATVLSSAVTCDGGSDAATISDTALASTGTLRMVLGAPSGTVDSLFVDIQATQDL